MDILGAAYPQPNGFAWRFLGFLRDLAVKSVDQHSPPRRKERREIRQEKFFPTRKVLIC